MSSDFGPTPQSGAEDYRIRLMPYLRCLILCLLALMTGLTTSAQDAPISSDPVRISASSMGVGGLARIGDWAGIEIEFEDTHDSQRELIIQIEGIDSDGDSPLHQRTVTSNPGVLQRTWLYLWIPGTHSIRGKFIVSVYEAEDLDAATSERTGVSYKRGQLLTRMEIGGQKDLIPAEIATGLVIGRRLGGLADYSRTANGTGNSGTLHLPNGNEITLFANDIRPNDLPDRSTGLMQFETIIWSTADPSNLTLSRSEALIEWVRKGGHLVVCLPPTGLVWFDTDRNALASLLPDVSPEQLSSGESTVRALLTHDPNITMPDSLVIKDLVANASAEPHEAVAILRDAVGHTVVSRRNVDLGMVTLIGIDITNRNLADRGLPAMDAFWHRVLGKRGKPIDTNPNNSIFSTSRELRSFDSEIATSISSSGSAGLALLLGFALFAVYWAIGGPLGYAILKNFGLKKHTWLAFVAAIGLFTLVGWGGVSILRPRTANLQQVVFLDAVEGSTIQRARSFASIFFPGYADASVQVGEPDNDFAGFHDSVTHWTEQFNAVLASASFPDARAYPVSARDPNLMRFPARATEKRFRLDWTGPERWPMFDAVTESGGPGQLRLDGNGNISGSLVHNLPGNIHDVVIIVVKEQRSIGTQTGASEVSLYNAYKLPGGSNWQPGIEHAKNLAELAAASADQRTNASTYFDDLLSRARGSELSATFTRGSANERLVASAFVSQLSPPNPSDRGEKGAGVRRSTHGLDLGRWISQPCVMVLGIVDIQAGDDAMNPLPVSIKRNGGWDEVDWSGKVVVRWVYPLRENTPDWTTFGTGLQPTESTTPDGSEGNG